MCHNKGNPFDIMQKGVIALVKHMADNAENSYKCNNCGNFFSKGNKSSATCPVCNNVCTKDSCVTLGASNEGY